MLGEHDYTPTCILPLINYSSDFKGVKILSHTKLPSDSIAMLDTGSTYTVINSKIAQ